MASKIEIPIKKKCCICNKYLSSYATKYVNPKTGEVICYYEQPKGCGRSRNEMEMEKKGWKIYSDG